MILITSFTNSVIIQIGIAINDKYIKIKNINIINGNFLDVNRTRAKKLQFY